MTRLNSSYQFKYDDEYISYQSLFSRFNINHFHDLHREYDEMSVEKKIMELFSGNIINYSENQSALHHIYRSAYGYKNSKVDDSLLSEAKETINRCMQLKNTLLEKGFKNIVTIGIGGSFEGPKLLIETLTKKNLRNFNHIFLTGPDRDEFQEKILPLKNKETYFIVSSKSFSTDETLQSLSFAKDWIGQNLNFEDHFICITSQIEKAKNFGFDEKTAIQFPNEIGGRYSLWSPISLSAIIELGESFSEFLKGGSEADLKLIKDVKYKKFIKSVIFSDIWHHNYQGLGIRVVLAYIWKLRFLTDYVQQLEMESIGKASNNNSKFNYTGQIIFGGFGSTAQHSYFQLLHQGTSSFCADIINLKDDKTNNPLLFAQSQAQSGLLAFGEDNNLHEYERVNGGSPVNLFTLNNINAQTLGYLVAFWEHRVFLTACMLQINPYDQFGVSAGKIFTKKYLNEKGD